LTTTRRARSSGKADDGCIVVFMTLPLLPQARMLCSLKALHSPGIADVGPQRRSTLGSHSECP
jgi:hypothetical protein